MKHLKNNIGLYLVGLLLLAIGFDNPNDDYPLGIWIFGIVHVAWFAPPFNLQDRFINLVYKFYEWLFQIPVKLLKKTPKWFQLIFILGLIVLIEEFVLSPLGQTMYPWRMDFSG